MNLGSLDENQESESLDQQGLGASSYFSLDLCPSEKCIYHPEAETVNAGTKFIIRDIAQRVGEDLEKWFVYLRQKQGRDAHLERKGVGVLPSEEECSKEAVKTFI